jgi:hypothetical protein
MKSFLFASQLQTQALISIFDQTACDIAKEIVGKIFLLALL